MFASAGLPGLSGFVGEFLTLVGTFVASPWAAAVATLVMILAAAYLLWMFQRVVLGEPSPFLLGLKHHLTDMTPTEILTLAPLGALVLAFGLFPGILLDLFEAARRGRPRGRGHGGGHRGRSAARRDRARLVAAVVAVRFVAVMGRRTRVTIPRPR